MLKSKGRPLPIAITLCLIVSCASSSSMRGAPEPETASPPGTTRFHEGVCYRREGRVIQIEVKGDHHEMGLQYGVLLRYEIARTAGTIDQVIRHAAEETGIWAPVLTLYLDIQSSRIMRRLPGRFIEEMRGVAEGAGVRFSIIRRMNTLYDVMKLSGCTSIVCRDDEGGILHARTMDVEWGNVWPETVLLKCRPDGYQEYVSVGWPGFLGTQTACNGAGITYSENTLKARNGNPDGISVNYLSRMILEECSDLEEAGGVLDRFSSIGGESLIMADLNAKTGGVFEITPRARGNWHVTWMTEGPLGAVNRYLYSDYRRDVEDFYEADNGDNKGREAILKDALDKKAGYSVEEMVGILRSSVGPDGRDYLRDQHLRGICNQNTIQMVVFSPDNTGLWLSTGRSCASRSEVTFYPSDFSRNPSFFMKADPLEPEIAEVFQVQNGILSGPDEMRAWEGLADRYPSSSLTHLGLAYSALSSNRRDLYCTHVKDAFLLDPGNPDVMVDMASVHFIEGKYSESVDILRRVDPKGLSSCTYRALRLSLLVHGSRHLHYAESVEGYEEELAKELQGDAAARKDIQKRMRILGE